MKIEESGTGRIETWTVQEVAAARDKGEIVLIDVRTPQEYAFERIGGALLLAMQDFAAAHLPGQTDKRIVLHCGSGVRSGKVAALCVAHGILPIAHMEGGFGAWKEAGLDYIGTDMATGAPKTTHQGG